MNSKKKCLLIYLSVVVYMDCEKYVQLVSNSRKISVLIYINSEKYICFDNNSENVSIGI